MSESVKTTNQDPKSPSTRKVILSVVLTASAVLSAFAYLVPDVVEVPLRLVLDALRYLLGG